MIVVLLVVAIALGVHTNRHTGLEQQGLILVRNSQGLILVRNTQGLNLTREARLRQAEMRRGTRAGIGCRGREWTQVGKSFM